MSSMIISDAFVLLLTKTAIIQLGNTTFVLWRASKKNTIYKEALSVVIIECGDLKNERETLYYLFYSAVLLCLFRYENELHVQKM